MRKADIMYGYFGTGEGFCKDCNHLIRYRESYYKCEVYGISSSQATDWKAKTIACGMKNKPCDGMKPIYKNKTKENREEPMEGQMNLTEFMRG